MIDFAYKVVVVGAKTAAALEKTINELATEGWELESSVTLKTGDALIFSYQKIELKVETSGTEDHFYEILNQLKVSKLKGQ